MSVAYEPARCPVCDRPDAVVIADREGVLRELEHLWAFHLRRVRPRTPLETLTDRAIFTQRPSFQLVRCLMCGTVYRNPRERETALTEAYAEADTDTATMSALFEAQRPRFRRQAHRLTGILGRCGTGLEVGSYTGAFLMAAREAGWSFEGLDLDEGANQIARALGFRISRGRLEDFSAAHTFDAVAIWNCFEQLPNPRAAARSAHSLLGPGGVLAVRVPNGAFYAAVRRRLDGPGSGIARAVLAHSNLLGFPYRHGFTAPALASLLRDAGFEIVALSGETLLPTVQGWTRRWAVLEGRAVEAMLRAVAACGPAPWFEVYARRTRPNRRIRTSIPLPGA